MPNRLVVPFVFIAVLVVSAVVMQSLGDSAEEGVSPTGPESLRQYEVVETLPPTLTLINKDSKKVDSSLIFAKPTLITFWSVNCGECDIGLPVLDDFASKQSQLTINLISTRDQPNDAEEKLSSLGIKLSTYYDLDGTTFQNWGSTMPASYFITGGKVRYFFPGRISQELLDLLLTVR